MISHTSIPRVLFLLSLALALFATATEAKEKKNKIKKKAVEAAIEKLDPEYRRWLYAVELLITLEEKAAFVELEKDYQRDAFIERFWKERDPYPGSARNELREDYEARIAQGRLEFGDDLRDDRIKVLLTNGPPLNRIEVDCKPSFYPMEVWYYRGSDKFRMDFLLLFYQRWGRGPFLLWEPSLGLREIQDSMPSAAASSNNPFSGQGDCRQDDADALRAAISFINNQGGPGGAIQFFQRLLSPPVEPSSEWLATFASYSTDLDATAPTFPAEVAIDYVGRYQSRTIMQASVGVPVSEVAKSQLGTHSAYNLLITGEVLYGDKLFDTFRYKFDFPENEVHSDTLPLVFQRNLRPGDYTLIIKAEDVPGKRFFRDEREIFVPHVPETAPEPADPETARLLAEANAAIRSGETTLEIAPLHGDWQTGLVRINTLSTGNGLDKVTFMLDNVPILTKKRPPYDVELDLGDVPRSRVLRVEGYDAEGNEIASDEVMINAGNHRFAVRLEEPRKGKRYNTSLRAEADVIVPDGEVVERVEYYLNETLLATLYQPPWTQPIILPQGEEVAYVRAVAFMPDGRSTEDLVFVNAPPNLEEVDVDFVELYTLVLDKDQRPVEGLTQADFTILEDEVPQEPVRFEIVRNLPIHAAVMLDVSASMEGRLEKTQEAALSFFSQAITPKDRATVITFNDHPNLAAKFTNDVDVLAGGLAGLKAERGTALYDSIIFTLYYFNGIKGQRAIVLLSDGKDESSRFEFRDALEYAHRAGVVIYSIGLDLQKRDGDARRNLVKLAEETGGRSFFIEDVAQLSGVYDTIQRELRSRYLLAYQSSNTRNKTRFRSIDVETPKGTEAKTLRGYYP